MVLAIAFCSRILVLIFYEKHFPSQSCEEFLHLFYQFYFVGIFGRDGDVLKGVGNVEFFHDFRVVSVWNVECSTASSVEGEELS